MAGFGSGWWQRGSENPLGISRISLCSQEMLLKMLRGNGSDTRGRAGTQQSVALGLLVGLAGLEMDFTREGINN